MRNRVQRNYVTLRSGERVRYTLSQRSDSPLYFVHYVGPGDKRRERSTDATKKPEAMEAACRIIQEDYEPAVKPEVTGGVGWEAARAKLTEAMQADGKRPATIKGYMETLTKLTAMFPALRGPGDVSEHTAEAFKVGYGSGKKATDEARKKKSLDSRIRTLKAVFGWFVKLRLCAFNPFEKVEQPELDRHEVKYVKEADIAAFFEWLEKRYPGWAMPRLFFSAKAVTGCRLEDICGLESKQLRDGRIVFTADTTKNRSERHAILPDDLYAELLAYRGPSYVWERYPAELKEANKKLGVPTHRQNLEFAPRRLYQWVVQIMQVYQEESGTHLSSHDFRKAAFTRAAEDDIHPKRAAVAFDVTAETMMRYYTATEMKQTADDVLGGLAGKLLPRKKREEE